MPGRGWAPGRCGCFLLGGGFVTAPGTPGALWRGLQQRSVVSAGSVRWAERTTTRTTILSSQVTYFQYVCASRGPGKRGRVNRQRHPRHDCQGR
jgi:hypothetical protein